MKHEELKLGLAVKCIDGECEGWVGKVKAYHPHNPRSLVLVDLGKKGLWNVPLEYLVSLGVPIEFVEGKNNMEVPKPLDNFHDIHYQTAHQPIEVMQANMSKEELIGFLKGNIIKYACRCGRKDAALNEADKIKRYAAWLVDVLQGKTIDPRK